MLENKINKIMIKKNKSNNKKRIKKASNIKK